MLFGVRKMIESGQGFNPCLMMVDGEEPEIEGGDTPETDPDPKTGKDRLHGLREANKAERERAQALQAELDALKAANAERERKAKEEQGQFQELYQSASTELETAKAQLAEFQKRETERLERITAQAAEAAKALPENLRALVPEGLSPDATLAQVQKLQALAGQSPTGTMGGGGKRPTKVPDHTPAEKAGAEDLMRSHPLMDFDTALMSFRALNKKT